MRDSTCDTVIGKIAADVLVARMEELEVRKRALVFAYVGIGVPLVTLAKELDITADQARAEVREGLETLRADQDLQLLVGIRRAGELADFHRHVRRLGLESWFCQHCHGFQVQKGRGRPRLTCSDACRRERNRAVRRGASAR